MPNTPLLGITQVSASQNTKEVTINDAILALENATNAKKDISFAAGVTYTLTTTEITRNFVLIAKSATAASTLNVPNQINEVNLTRLFVVRNESGQGLTVKFATGAGTTVVIPNNQTRLLAALDGLNIIVAAEPQAAINFLALEDTPNTFAGVQGKFLGVNVAENALVFLDAATFPSFTGNAGKYLVVNATADGVGWVDAAVVATFLDLTDAPASYVGAGGKLVAVKSDATGVEFIDPPAAEAVEFVASAQWRVLATQPGLETQVAFGEVEFLNKNGFDLATGGTASASSFDPGKEPEFAFDNNLDAGAGWFSDELAVGEQWIAYTFATAVTVRSVRLTPVTNFPDFTPLRVELQYWNGAAWVEAGDHLTAPWVDTEAQTFRVAGFPLQSVPDAPADGEQYARRNNAWQVVAAAPTDGGLYARKDGAWVLVPQVYSVPFGFTTPPTADEVLLITVFAEAVTFPDEFTGSIAAAGVNPAAETVFLVRKNGADVGTISVATSGVTTFNTTGGAVAFAIGDVLSIVAPTTPDTIISNRAFTLVAEKD